MSRIPLDNNIVVIINTIALTAEEPVYGLA